MKHLVSAHIEHSSETEKKVNTMNTLIKQLPLLKSIKTSMSVLNHKKYIECIDGPMATYNVSFIIEHETQNKDEQERIESSMYEHISNTFSEIFKDDFLFSDVNTKPRFRLLGITI